MQLHRIRRYQIGALPLLGVCAAIVLALKAPAAAQVGRSATDPTPTATSQIESMQVVAASLPPTKKAFLDRIERLREEGLSKAGSAVVEPAPHTTPQPWPSGIFERSQAPFPSMLYRISNQWQDIVGGVHVQVYAGEETATPSLGVVIVQTTSLDLLTSQDAVYQAPSMGGMLRIVAVHGSQLTLDAANGATFTFDVPTRSLAPTTPRQ